MTDESGEISMLKDINLTQCRFIAECEIVNEVITLQEASQILDLNDSTLRKMVLSKRFPEGTYRKTSKVILFNKGIILELQRTIKK